MKGFVARVVSSLLGGLVAFILGTLLYNFYAKTFDAWSDVVMEFGKFIAPQFRDAIEELEESRRILRLLVSVFMASGFAIGYLLTPLVEYQLNELSKRLNRLAQRLTRQRLIVTSAGVFAGMLLSALLINAPVFYYLAGLKKTVYALPYGMVLLHILVILIFGYAGGYLTSAVFFPPSSRASILARYQVEPKPRILDTSVLIDGRIAEILKTGFIPGLLIIPKAVVHELQLIADSSDNIKRNKGRRGLEILKSLEDSVPNPVHFYDDSHLSSGANSVDDILIEIAEELDAEVVTNDYNLNRVASIRKVTVLNINELANAVKPMVIPGATLVIDILKEGKEHGQGVGYLEDGTMVVVEQGSPYIGKTCEVEVTSIMQTVAGRLIFSKVRQVLESKAVKGGL